MSEEIKIINVRVPKNALVILVGVSGSGKSTFANQNFPGAVVSSDRCRRILAGDDNAHNDDIQKLSEGAFLMLFAWIRARLRHNLLTVADTTALRREYREDLSKIAETEHCPVVYLFFDTSFEEALKRQSLRPAHEQVPEGVLKKQYSNLNRSRGFLRNADNVYTIKPGNSVEITFTDPKMGIQADAIDVVGDVHGCFDELIQLVEKLGYKPEFEPTPETLASVQTGLYGGGVNRLYKHPFRKLVFVGDLIDRGPEPFKTLEFVRAHVEAGLAYLVLSNHERKLRNFLSGRPVNVKPEFQKSLDSIPADFDRSKLKKFLYNLKPYLLWTEKTFTTVQADTWAITHAAFKPEFAGKVDKEIEEYCVYGPVNSVSPEGIPDRIAWWDEYRGKINVVYGHICTDDSKPRVVNRTYGIDTACVHGGELTALRLPEREFVSVKAAKVYHGRLEFPGSEKSKDTPRPPAFLEQPRVTVTGLDGKFQDIWIKGGLWDAVNQLTTRTISPEKLVWLAPTMSPGPVSEDESVMEDPITTAKWMLNNGPKDAKLIAQVKHMGSRGTWSYDTETEEVVCWTKNGFDMFEKENVRQLMYGRMKAPLAEIAREYGLKKVLVDSEVMPFNQHGADWLERTFMTTAGSARISREAIKSALLRAGQTELAQNFADKSDQARLFGEVADRFCWPTNNVGAIKVGMFRVLNGGGTHSDQIRYLNSVAARHVHLLRETDYLVIDAETLPNLETFWAQHTSIHRAEGVVLKYNDPAVYSTNKWPQQQLKVRSKDYLRIVYGPSYLEPKILADLRKNRREDTKQRMAYQETLLGNEALKRLNSGESWERVHELLVAIYAADRASVDPRL